jgi:hypothetical protein
MKPMPIAALALLLPFAPDARAFAPAELCGGPVSRVVVPAAWSTTLNDGSVTYRSESGREAVTSAVYAYPAPVLADDGRRALLSRMVQVHRDVERGAGGDRVTLSAVRVLRARGQLQACLSGFDPDRGRRFVSISIATDKMLQHLYYEAVGLPQRDFARRTLQVLGAPGSQHGAVHRELLPAPLPMPQVGKLGKSGQTYLRK